MKSNNPTSHKIIILKNNANHFWQSLNVIEDNISFAFNSSSLDYEYFDIEKELTEDQKARLKNLVLFHSVFLYFLSDNIDYEKLITQFKQIGKLTYLIPIYGNMTIEVDRWHILNQMLIGENVFLIAASKRSSNQLRVLTDDGNAIQTIPYPMELIKDKDQRVKDNIIRIVYAGRITTGKNILQLMEVFTHAVGFKSILELHIAGDFHDRGHHFHGYEIPFANLKESFFNLVNNSNSKIIYHGQLSQPDLFDLYSKMDVFCSPSTYHDEDFGVSAAQAGLSGLKLLLSDWGGHASFPGADLIRVNVDALNIPKIDSTMLFKKLLSITKLEQKNENIQMKDYLSFARFNEQILNLINHSVCSFKGASSTYFDFCEAYKKGPPFFGGTPESSKLYFEIYNSYLGK